MTTWAKLALAAILVTAPPALASDGWAIYTDPALGLRSELPLARFAPDPGAMGSVQFVEIGGPAQISLYAGDTQGLDIDNFIAGLASADATRTVTYSARGQSWAVLSGTYPDVLSGEPVIFYTKILYSADAARFAGFEMSYPLALRADYDDIVERIEDGFSRPAAYR